MSRLSQLKARVKNAFQKPLVRGTFWKLTARVSSLFLQSAYFLIIARTLGVEQYGLFIGVMALIKLFVPFSNWGTSHILLKHVSRNREVFRQYWGNSLCITSILGAIFLCVILSINQFLIPDPFPTTLLLIIGLAELIFARIHDIAIKSFLSTDFFKLDTIINILLSLNGLIAATCMLVFFPSATAIIWGALYLISRFITALIDFFLVCRVLGKPRLKLSLMKPEVLQGFYFSLGLSSQTIYKDADKTMLASMSTLEATGIYGAAYRILEVAMIPIISLVAVTYSHFFREGARGVKGSLAFAKKVVPVSSGYGLIASIGLFICAPLTPYILGEEYAKSVEALYWLSPMIFFKSIQLFAADTLTGAGRQGIRSILQVGAASLNVVLNLWLIPLYSWRGAAWSSLATDGLLVVLLWGLIFLYYRQENIEASSQES